MFDPIFTLLFFAAVILPIAAIVFALVIKHRMFGSALLLAFIVPVAGLIGFFGSVNVHRNFDSHFFDEPPLVRVLVSLIAAILLAWLAGYITWRTGTKRVPRAKQ